MFESWTVDQLERTLIEAEQQIGRLRAMQMALLDRLDVAQVARLDGSRNLAEWVAARADLDQQTARDLVITTRTTADRPELRIPLAEGDSSFSRCAATARLAITGASPATINGSAGLDIAGVHRLASRHRRFTPVDEREAFERRHLVMQTSLDTAMGRIYGEFAGYEWRVIEKAINERADAFPADPAGERAAASQRRADALAAMCQDALDGNASGDRSAAAPLVTVFVDARTKIADPNLVDAAIESGPRVGVDAIERILCGGSVELIGVMGDGTPLTMGRTRRAIPPKLRRFILHRDDGCTVDGCASRYRLQPHHIVPWSEGGRTDPENLTTLCWYHHHVVVHGRGFVMDRSSPPHRRRFIRRHTNKAPPQTAAV